MLNQDLQQKIRKLNIIFTTENKITAIKKDSELSESLLFYR